MLVSAWAPWPPGAPGWPLPVPPRRTAHVTRRWKPPRWRAARAPEQHPHRSRRRRTRCRGRGGRRPGSADSCLLRRDREAGRPALELIQLQDQRVLPGPVVVLPSVELLKAQVLIEGDRRLVVER